MRVWPYTGRLRPAIAIAVTILLAGCQAEAIPTPTNTSAPSPTPYPVPTARPTFDPTTVAVLEASDDGIPRRDQPYSYASLPAGYRIETVATGLTNPSAFDGAPDGRIFVVEQFAGVVRVIRNGVLEPQPYFTVPDLWIEAERGFVSEARLEDARLAVERARDSSSLTAPADGIILRRHADPAQSVAAGAPIFAFGETASGIVVRAPVASGAATRLSIGAGARVRITELAGEARQARVARIAGQGDSGTGAFEVEIEVTNAEGLRSGMVGAVEIDAALGATAENALLVPALALLDARADQGIVYVVDAEGIARRRPVRTAGVIQTGVLIIEGLNSGERVVSAGAAYVRDGEPVRIAAAS